MNKDQDKNKALDDLMQLIKTRDGKPYPIPVEGSLGLLALGYKGLMAWRARREIFEKRAKEKGKNG